MEEDLRTLIQGNASVAALVNSRVFWAQRPQGDALPSVVLWLISEPNEYTLDGAVDLVASQVQADCWALSAASATAVKRALSKFLSGYAGEHGETLFQGVFQDNARATRDAGTDDAERFFRSSLDFIVNHQPKD